VCIPSNICRGRQTSSAFEAQREVIEAFALHANRLPGVGITKPEYVDAVLILAFAPPLLCMRVRQHIPEQRNARSLEILPVERYRNLDG
jgi:hypothetical protein